MIRITTLALLFSIAGCVDMDDALTPLRGQKAEVIAGKLGYPTTQREVMGHKVYRWETGNVSSMYCNLDAAVDGAGSIESTSWSGNNGGCASLIARLKGD